MMLYADTARDARRALEIKDMGLAPLPDYLEREEPAGE